MTTNLESELPAIRRYGSLLLGSKQKADDHLTHILSDRPNVDGGNGSDRRWADLYHLFHSYPLPRADLEIEDFREADQRMLQSLHKLPMYDRALLLLTSTAALNRNRIAALLGFDREDFPARLMKVRALLHASYRNRLCIIVEDDLIAMRDLQAEMIQAQLGVAGIAKNQTEALGLTDSIRPDIAFIDLALPEGATAGADIALRLRERCATRIVFVTAFAKLAKALAGPLDMILPKPWSARSMRLAIASATG